MAAITRTFVVADFIPRSFSFQKNDAGDWVIFVVGDEVDSGGNVLFANVSQGFDMPAARVATWTTFAAQITKAAKVKLGLDDGT